MIALRPFVNQQDESGTVKDALPPRVNPGQHRPLLSATRGSLVGALLLLFLGCDRHRKSRGVGSCLPGLVFGSLVKNVTQRPGWKIALFRTMIPAVTLALVLGNNSLQWQIAEANADRVIKACQEFRAAHGDYPGQLDELVPDYLDSMPRAKYCLLYGDFRLRCG